VKNDTHLYEIRPRKDHRGVDLISDALPFGRLWYGEPNAISNAIDYAKFRTRSHDAVIRLSAFMRLERTYLLIRISTPAAPIVMPAPLVVEWRCMRTPF